MSETLFNQFADEGALQAQKDFFLKEILGPIKEGIKGLNLNIGTIDTGQSKRSVDELAKNIDILENKLGVAQKEIAALTAKLNDYSVAVSGTTKSQKDLVNATTALTISLKEGSKAAYDNAKAKKDAAQSEVIAAKAAYDSLKAKDGVAAAELKAAKATLDTVKAKRDSANADLAEAKAALSTANAKKSIIKETQTEQKLIEDAANDYLQLAKAYNEAALKAKNYVLRLGENHPISVQAVKDANDIGNTLKRLDASVGQNQRNVGNYASAVSGLGFSFTQVARELPSLAVNFQQFALAISNNLPFVADSLVRTRAEIAALRAEGKQAPSMFSAITKSLLTWQVALAVGITIFTVYAKQIGEFFSKLLLGNGELSKTAKLFKEINAEAAKTSGEDLAKLSEMSLKLNDVNKSAKERLEVLKVYNETASKANEIDESQINNLKLINEKIAEQNVLILKRAVSLAATAKLGETASKFVEQELNLGLIAQKTGKDIGNLVVETANLKTEISAITGNRKADALGYIEITDKEEKAYEKLIKTTGNYLNLNRKEVLQLLTTVDARNKAKKELEDQSLALEPLINFELDKKKLKGSASDIKKKFLDFINDLDLRIKIKLDFAADDKNSIGERLKALREAGKLERQKLQQEAQFAIKEARQRAQEEIENAKGDAKKIAAIKSNLNIDIINIQNKLNHDVENEVYDSGKRILTLQTKFYEQLIGNTKEGEKVLAELKKGYLEERHRDAEADFEKQKIAINDFAEQEVKIRRAAYRRAISQAGDSTEARIKAEGIYYEGIKELDRKTKKDLIQAELDYTKALLVLAKLRRAPENEIKKLEAVLKSLQTQIDNLDFAAFEELEAIIKSLKEKIEDAALSLRQLFVDAIKDIAGNVYEKQLQDIDALIQKNNDLKDATVKRIQTEQISEQDKAAKIQILNAETERRNNQLEARKRAIETRKAQFEKAAALFQIGLDLAKALNKIKLEALATPNPVLKALILAQIPIAIASSAIQAAIVGSKPIPKYAKGTDYSEEGVAEVAERGPELAIDPKGNAKVYEKHTLTYLTKGTKIYPADATKDILNAAEQDRSTLLKQFNNNVTISTPDHGEKLDKMNKTLERIESKSRIAIINNAAIETEAWYQQHFKF